MRLLATLALLILPAAAEEPSGWISIEAVEPRERRPFRGDAVFAKHLLDPAAAPPRAGEEIGGKRWAEGVSGGAGWAYAAVDSPKRRVVIAELSGAGALFVNGEAFAGDVYGGGLPGVPVVLREGRNDLFVTQTRGPFRLRFAEPNGPLAARDMTLPDGDGWGAAVLRNASEETREFELRCGDFATRVLLPPLAVEKVPFEVAADTVSCGDTTRDLERRKPDGVRVVTFRSRVDGSVQYYAMREPEEPAGAGLVVTLHGAGVEAFANARAYARKPDFWIVAPNNRRPFGFDWQDWGRIDAYEALEHALGVTGVDPARVFLTGHSMGGHGAWHLAANDPDGFAAVAPCAAWISFDTYTGTNPAHLDPSSRTLDLLDNLEQLPVHILHGSADENVPASEGRRMAALLPHAQSRFEEGRGHWWNDKETPGVDCVDAPAIFEMFRGTPPAAEPRVVSYVCADPAVDPQHRWARIEQPLRYGETSRIRAAIARGELRVETSNVHRFAVEPPEAVSRVVVDGVEFPGTARRFRHGWVEDAGAPAAEKRPERSGPFKLAFDNDFVLVYGDAVDYARARYDAQLWWVRGNGRARLLPGDGEIPPGNVILYGNADTNPAWRKLLPASCPIDVDAGSIRIGGARLSGDDLGCVFVYPRAGTDDALVGVFGRTGERGARLGYTLAPFSSGVAYPDYAVFTSRVLQTGAPDVSGYFTRAWELPPR